MKRLCVFWRENKSPPPSFFFFVCRNEILSSLLPSGLIFFPHWFRCIREAQPKMEYSVNGGKKWNNRSIDHFPSARSQAAVHRCFIPILSHYGLFSHRPQKKVASRSDHDTPAHHTFLKMDPIWVLERKLAGVQMRHLGSSAALVRLGLICSLQERRAAGPDRSWLRAEESEAMVLGGPKTCRLIREGARRL